VFIFFEAAAAFEAFCYDVYILAIRKEFQVGPKVAKLLGGNIDGGKVMGWAAPPILARRAQKVFGKQHFLSKLQKDLPANTHDWLVAAHRMRNRIAHPASDSGGKEYRKIFTLLTVPPAMRGAGPARLLSDYPTANGATDKSFHRFLTAYEEFANHVSSHL